MIKKIMTASVMWLSVTAGGHSLLAQQPKENTLGSLWPEVEQNYSGIRAKNAAIRAALLNEKAVKGAQLPQVNAQIQTTYGTYAGSRGGFFAQPGIFNVNGTDRMPQSDDMAANSFGSITAEWELYAFGKRRKESQAAGAQVDKAVSEKEAYLLHLKKILSERYIALLYNDAKLSWTRKNVQRLNDIRKVTAGLSAAGLRPAADSLLASSSYIRALGELDKWKGFKDAAFIKLSELLEDSLVNYEASANRFVRPAGAFVNAGDSIYPMHPILDVLAQQSRFYTLSGEARKRSSLPSLRLLGGYAYRGTGINRDGTASAAWADGFHNSTNNMLAGIGIVWNISGLHTNRLKGASLLKEAEETRWLQIRYEEAMQADLSASHTEIKQQYEQLQKTRVAVMQAQNAYNMFLARYKSGLISLTELLQIRTLLEQAEDNHIEASRTYWLSLATEAELAADFNFLFNHL